MKEGEHRTSNIELPTSNGSGVGYSVFSWGFSVECSMLNVFADFPEAAFRAGWAGDSGGDEREEMKDGEHRTSNIEHRTPNKVWLAPRRSHSMLDVGCWMFDVPPNSPEVPS
jgi:hypothetical protein